MPCSTADQSMMCYPVSVASLSHSAHELIHDDDFLYRGCGTLLLHHISSTRRNYARNLPRHGHSQLQSAPGRLCWNHTVRVISLNPFPTHPVTRDLEQGCCSNKVVVNKPHRHRVKQGRTTSSATTLFKLVIEFEQVGNKVVRP